MQIKKAVRSLAKARIGLVAPSGAGKTHSALLIASTLTTNPKICVIDTENGSASLEVGKPNIPEFDTITLTAPFSPKRYVEAIHLAEKENYNIIVIDSLSHAWSGTGGSLDQVNAQAQSNRGNSYTAWRNVTPEHNSLIDAIIQSPAHIIATMRAKVEYVIEKDDRGKSVPRKIGLAPIQRDGMDYEFTVVFDIAQDSHYATTSKDRTSIFDGTSRILSPDDGKLIREWLNGAIEVTPIVDRMTEDQAFMIDALLARLQKTPQDLDIFCQKSFQKNAKDMTKEEAQKVVDALSAKADKLDEEPTLDLPEPQSEVGKKIKKAIPKKK